MKNTQKGFLPTRRQVIKAGLIAGAGMMVPWRFLPAKAFASPAMWGLSDPALQPKFVNPVPDALAPSFHFDASRRTGQYHIVAARTRQWTGLINPRNGSKQNTWLWGYGSLTGQGVTWPGRTFEVKNVKAGGSRETIVNWYNWMGWQREHLLPLDTNLHWCYSLHNYKKYTIKNAGVPIITHLHGGHSDFQFDGNPEFFYGPRRFWGRVIGPQWANVPGGFTTKFRYDNDVQAGNLWYHDHALGITRLNVYAGMAGFYFVRDRVDTGESSNPIGLPAWPYEKAYAIQDRMFKANGSLFYPAFPGEPFYDDFIDDNVTLPPDLFPGGGPTALAEFFGDHMVVNGMIWPFEKVEPRNYRLHLLNGTDSRFMGIQLFEVPPGTTDLRGTKSRQIPFTVVGSDQGLASRATTVKTLLSEPGSRYDIIVDFSDVTFGNRVIMKNILGDTPFGGDIDDPGAPRDFSETDRILAFDVVLPRSAIDDRFNADTFNRIQLSQNSAISVNTTVDRIRKVALFEGRDEFGRLQPLLGTAEEASDYQHQPINWPGNPVYSTVGLTGPMNGSVAWHSPTTENPALGDTEEWEIWNLTGDAHPVHLHLVNFKILGRQEIVFDSNADEDGFIMPDMSPADDGIYLVSQPTVQHNSVAGNPDTYGMGFKIFQPSNPRDAYGAIVRKPVEYVENAPKDMVTALPGQITRIRMTFDKPGRYVWHCHILSHEDHEMMRVLHVGPGA